MWQPIEEVVGVAVADIHKQFPSLLIDAKIPQNFPLVEIDAVLFERVFSNLIGNAVKYAGESKPLRILAIEYPDEIRIMIEDEGPGIPQQLQSIVFEKFKRGDEESSQPGVGLGLSICKAIVEAHGGRIWIENNEPTGARFVIAIPNVQPPEDIFREWSSHAS
jgi:two-component system sensor histidine kinase KdpD